MKTRFITSVLVFGLLCIAASWTAYAQGQKTSLARQAWDYKTLAFDVNGQWDIYTLTEDGVGIASSTRPSSDSTIHVDPTLRSALPKLKELGNDGWELVASTASEYGSLSRQRYFLKRAK